jgi:hypothetical protein
LGGWFNADSVATPRGLITKGTSVAAASAYELWLENTATPDLAFRVSTGAAFITVVLHNIFVQSAWSFCAARFIPSTELKCWYNTVSATNIVAVPATLRASTETFVVGAFDPNVLPFDGRASLVFLCAAALSDETITALFQNTRSIFGV